MSTKLNMGENPLVKAMSRNNDSDGKPSLIRDFGRRYSIAPTEVLEVLRQTAFRGVADQITNNQMISLLVIANQYGLNPFTKEIYAFPDKGSIIPVVGFDGWVSMAHQHSHFGGVEFTESDTTLKTEDGCDIVCPTWIECKIYRKDCMKPFTLREYFQEVYRRPFKSRTGSVIKGPWQSHPRRMLRHKAFIQCARLAFGFSGVYDPDEAERIIEAPKPVYQGDGAEGEVYESKADAISAALKQDEQSKEGGEQ